RLLYHSARIASEDGETRLAHARAFHEWMHEAVPDGLRHRIRRTRHAENAAGRKRLVTGEEDETGLARFLVGLDLERVVSSGDAQLLTGLDLDRHHQGQWRDLARLVDRKQLDVNVCRRL